MSLSDGPRATPRAGRTVPVLWAVLALLLVLGAGVAGTAAYFVLHAKGSTTGPIQLVDDLGRNVTVPADPARVVVLGPSIVDTMVRLGLRGQIVGVDCYSPALGGIADDYTPGQIAQWNLTASMCVSVAPTFDVESLLNLTPQLVLASTIVSTASIEAVSTTYHLPVVFLQPTTVSGVLVDVQLVGRIFGVPGPAATLTGALSRELARSSALTGNASTVFPSVLLTYDTDSSGYWTFGPGTFGESLLELAGARGIGANASLAYPELPPEVVLADNPSHIVYATGFGLNASSYSGAPLWSRLPAVQNGNVSGIDSTWVTEADPTMILQGLPALIAIVHPSTT